MSVMKINAFTVWHDISGCVRVIFLCELRNKLKWKDEIVTCVLSICVWLKKKVFPDNFNCMTGGFINRTMITAQCFSKKLSNDFHYEFCIMGWF